MRGKPPAEQAVYHINAPSNAMQALGTIRKHLNASPNAGIDYLLEDAKDKSGIRYDAVVQERANRKVQFRVCNNAMEGRKIDRKRVMPQATVVPSGVAQVARLQFQESQAYIKP